MHVYFDIYINVVEENSRLEVHTELLTTTAGLGLAGIMTAQQINISQAAKNPLPIP